MTKLRDDGYLETDVPVVAACFFGRQIEDGYTLCVVRADGWDSWSEKEQSRYGSGYPILIPAATVAETLEFKSYHDTGWGIFQPQIAEHLLLEIKATTTMTGLVAWLRQHMEEVT